MKKLLVVFMLLCSFALFAQDEGGNYGAGSEAKSFYIQPNFGIGAAFYSYGGYSEYGYKLIDNYLGNQFGITVGADVVWSVWQNNDVAAGNLYVGADLAFEYWVPTKHKYDVDPVHVMRLPLQAYVSYEFDVDAGPLAAIGPYFSAGIGLNFVSFNKDQLEYTMFGEKSKKFQATFRWGLGGSIAFSSNLALKVGFGGDAGSAQKTFNWNNNSFFMLEAGYRF